MNPPASLCKPTGAAISYEAASAPPSSPPPHLDLFPHQQPVQFPVLHCSSVQAAAFSAFTCTDSLCRAAALMCHLKLTAQTATLPGPQRCRCQLLSGHEVPTCHLRHCCFTCFHCMLATVQAPAQEMPACQMQLGHVTWHLLCGFPCAGSQRSRCQLWDGPGAADDNAKGHADAGAVLVSRLSRPPQGPVSVAADQPAELFCCGEWAAGCQVRILPRVGHLWRVSCSDPADRKTLMARHAVPRKRRSACHRGSRHIALDERRAHWGRL